VISELQYVLQRNLWTSIAWMVSLLIYSDEYHKKEWFCSSRIHNLLYL